MNDFMIPPNHINFFAKKLFANMGEIIDVSMPHSVWNNLAETTIMIGISVKKQMPKTKKILEMKNLIKVLSIATFLSATVTVASIFYEGMVLKWFSYVGISILVTDILFLIATVTGVFYYKSNKTLFYAHLFSIFVILVGVVIFVIFGKDIPKFLFTLWEFYILYFYGIVVCKKLWQN